LSERFPGSVDADTSKPTAEGNYWVLEGMLRAHRIPVEQATVGLIGVGNIGQHMLERLRSNRARVVAVESRDERRAARAGGPPPARAALFVAPRCEPYCGGGPARPSSDGRPVRLAQARIMSL
jgi:hypothetical protein